MTPRASVFPVSRGTTRPGAKMKSNRSTATPHFWKNPDALDHLGPGSYPANNLVLAKIPIVIFVTNKI